MHMVQRGDREQVSARQLLHWRCRNDLRATFAAARRVKNSSDTYVFVVIYSCCSTPICLRTQINECNPCRQYGCNWCTNGNDEKCEYGGCTEGRTEVNACDSSMTSTVAQQTSQDSTTSVTNSMSTDIGDTVQTSTTSPETIIQDGFVSES